MDYKLKKDSWFIKAICLIFSISLFMASFAATVYLNLWGHVWDYYIAYKIQVSILGFIYVILFSIFLGFAIPAMLPGALKLHKGYNLYNGGLAFGLLGLFIYAFMYKTLGITPPENEPILNVTYALHGNSYQIFVTVYFLIIFLFFLLCGWYLNGKTFRGYEELLKSTGHTADFFAEFGVPNVWPVFAGYAVLSLFVAALCRISGLEIPWTLSTQGYLNGAAFATGLCPIAGRYGRRYGVIAGFMGAVLCTSTNAIHGGFMLYNGGLTTGITALIMVPCLEYYWKDRKRI